MTDPRVQIVADGYDVIGETFSEWKGRIVGDPRAAWRGELVSRLPQGSRVLDLGCGDGLPDTQLLAERFRVTGVDVSPEQVRRATAAVPSAEFVCADFSELELPQGSFDGVAAFYSFNHVPRDLLAPLFRSIRGWLVPGGLFLAALGTSNEEGLDRRVARHADVLLELSAADQLAAGRGGGLRAAPRRGGRLPGTGGRGRLPVDTCPGMSCAFDMEHYRELLEAAKAGGYEWASFDRHPRGGDLYLRHDVDLSLEAALEMARLEHEHGVRATYLLMRESAFYNLRLARRAVHAAAAPAVGPRRRAARRLPACRARPPLRQRDRLAQPGA